MIGTEPKTEPQQPQLRLEDLLTICAQWRKYCGWMSPLCADGLSVAYSMRLCCQV